MPILGIIYNNTELKNNRTKNLLPIKVDEVGTIEK